ncbi:VWA domain-containing protein [Aggregicoccus sp. 17bor-14]|uniref:VIT and vWA domain-containing protein n=1 Tax=Myxococcaceae TaxID=31 RepID=UPI00129C1969|nr:MULTISPECIES: VIT domain-containing protein [Myxococcaceae]MBF5046571.1 VWA domain-containing protein [Simulacricoccus sp. 17bor-14]MRI92282.1 VWA domain-containing protein [Aggregicoccus sp. 17bor-14]
MRPHALTALLLLFAPVALAAAPPDKTLSPYFFVEGAEGTDALPLKDTSAQLEVTGVIARVKVTQVYANEGQVPLHARYVFPASTRAAVNAMRMRLGDRTIEARIREKQAARAEFAKAKREGKSASLLEQERPNVFTMDVANVLPGDRIEVELEYTELLVPTEGIYELVFPTVVGPRYSNQTEERASEEAKWVQSPYLHEGKAPTYGFHLSGRISSALPLRDLSVPSHAVDLRWNGSSEVGFALKPTELAGGNRDFVLRYRLTGERIESGLMLQQGGPENFFLLLLEPPARVRPEQLPPREYVYILDVSGSMRGFPLETAKRVMRELAAGMRPQDSFNVVLFSGAHALMAPRSVPATAENVERAMNLIDSQSGGGGTELLPALEEALALPAAPGVARSFVVVTDGFISQERGVFEHIRKNLNQANVFSFGIGSSVNRYLVDGVAKAGGGEPFVVTTPEEARTEVTRFRKYIESPVLTDIRVSYEGFEAYDLEPPALPDLLASRPLVIFGKWRGKPQGRITVRGVSGEGPFVRSVDVAASKPSTEYSALRYLWARARISALSDFNLNQESDDEKQEVTRLGLQYNLLTRFTSFIAVHEQVRRTPAQGEGKDVKQPLPLPEGVSDAAVGEPPVQYGAEPELTGLALFALTLLGVTAALRRRAGFETRRAG